MASQRDKSLFHPSLRSGNQRTIRFFSTFRYARVNNVQFAERELNETKVSFRPSPLRGLGE